MNNKNHQIFLILQYISNAFFRKNKINNGLVVQLNRTSDSGSESRGFESLRGHLENK